MLALLVVVRIDMFNVDVTVRVELVVAVVLVVAVIVGAERTGGEGSQSTARVPSDELVHHPGEEQSTSSLANLASGTEAS